MKKLLKLLSVLTISGTTMPTLVANKKNPYNNSDTRISFVDNHGEWGWGPARGRIDFNAFSKKIEFTGGGYADNKFDTSVTIRIKNENKNIVKTIFIKKNKSLNDTIREYNLENDIEYKNGYFIDVWSEKANSTMFYYKNDGNGYVYNISDKPHTENFIIMRDKLWEIDAYTKEYFSLYLSWKNNNNIWKNEIGRQIRNDLPNYSVAQKRTWLGNTWNQLLAQNLSLNNILATIKNTIDIDNLKTDITSIKLKINDLENKFNDFKNNYLLKDDDSSKNHSRRLSECSIYSDFTGNLIGMVPIIGDIVSSITGLVSSACDVASLYV